MDIKELLERLERNLEELRRSRNDKWDMGYFSGYESAIDDIKLWLRKGGISKS